MPDWKGVLRGSLWFVFYTGLGAILTLNLLAWAIMLAPSGPPPADPSLAATAHPNDPHHKRTWVHGYMRSGRWVNGYWRG